MAGVVHIAWYATIFRADQFAAAVAEIAPIALRYRATDYSVHRSHDDRYKFLQLASFEDKDDFDRYWYGTEFNAWRTDYGSWYVVPVPYVWHDLVVAGSLEPNGVSAG